MKSKVIRLTEKRFKLAFEDFDGWAILDTTGEYSDDEDYIDWLSGQKAVDVLNHFAEENKHLKQALLFFLDVANGQCSSSFQKDMEHDCQKLFNCSYSEAKDKYGGYDATWWELGE